MATKAQEWARRRNWAKVQLKGAENLFRAANFRLSDILTEEEKAAFEKMQEICSVLLFDWKESNAESKEQYLRKEVSIG